MSLWDSILGLFGKKQGYQPAPPTPSQNQSQSQKHEPETVNNPTISKPKSRQVYEGRPVPPPDWAEGKSSSDIIAEIPKHICCRFAPKFEAKRIMTTQVGPDGNLIPEYEGIAGDCGALKQFGRKVAMQNGLPQPYRYVDLNLAYRACCGNPQKCIFFMTAQGDMESLNSRRR